VRVVIGVNQSLSIKRLGTAVPRIAAARDTEPALTVVCFHAARVYARRVPVCARCPFGADMSIPGTRERAWWIARSWHTFHFCAIVLSPRQRDGKGSSNCQSRGDHRDPIIDPIIENISTSVLPPPRPSSTPPRVYLELLPPRLEKCSVRAQRRRCREKCQRFHRVGARESLSLRSARERETEREKRAFLAARFTFASLALVPDLAFFRTARTVRYPRAIRLIRAHTRPLVPTSDKSIP